MSSKPDASQSSTSSSTTAFLFKVLVVGDAGAGKTCWVRRYVHNIFTPNYKATIGVDFALKKLQRDDKVVRLQLWDIAGQERFSNMMRVYYRDAVAAIVVYDVTRISTFENVEKWKKDIDEKVTLPNGDLLPVILVANKCDLLDQPFSESKREELRQFCKDMGFLTFFETSAKTGQNVAESVDYLTDILLEKAPVIKSSTGDDVIDVVGQDKAKEGGCC